MDSLRIHYRAIQYRLNELQGRSGIENPRFFDTIIDRAYRYEELDNWQRFWARFDAHDPSAALPWLQPSSAHTGRVSRQSARSRAATHCP